MLDKRKVVILRPNSHVAREIYVISHTIVKNINFKVVSRLIDSVINKHEDGENVFDDFSLSHINNNMYPES